MPVAEIWFVFYHSEYFTFYGRPADILFLPL